MIAGRESDGTYLVDDRGNGAVPHLARRHGGRPRSDRVVQASDRRAHRRPKARSRRIGFASALQAGLADQVDHLRSSSDSFSLPAWRKWSRMMTDERNAKAWPRVFADGQGLFGALLAIVEVGRRQREPMGRSPP